MGNGQIKALDDSALTKLYDLEGKLGCCIVALEGMPPLAELSAEQLKELQAVEKDLDTILIAYRC